MFPIIVWCKIPSRCERVPAISDALIIRTLLEILDMTTATPSSKSSVYNYCVRIFLCAYTLNDSHNLDLLDLKTNVQNLSCFRTRFCVVVVVVLAFKNKRMKCARKRQIDHCWCQERDVTPVLY